MIFMKTRSVLRRRWKALLRAPRRTEREILFFWQRTTRGWDDRSVWSMDHDLSKRLGAQLIYLGDIAHGFPGAPPYDGDTGFALWQADLRKAGAALTVYSQVDSLDLGHQYWNDSILVPAQEALRWIADNLPALWD